MKSVDEVLKTEYSEKFDTLRKNRMAVSYYKYGPAKDNYSTGNVNAIKSLEMRVEKYKETGNTEFLADIGNFAMLEYMYPQHQKAHFTATDSDKSPGIAGMSVEEIKRFQNEEY